MLLEILYIKITLVKDLSFEFESLEVIFLTVNSEQFPSVLQQSSVL